MSDTATTQEIPEGTEGDTGELTSEGIDSLLSDDDQGDEQEALAPEEETPPVEAAETPPETSGEVEAEALAPDVDDTAEAEATPEVPPETPAAEAQAAEETPPPAPEQEPPTVVEETSPEQWEEWRTGAIDRLAGRYTFSEEEEAAISENPASALPKLAAQVTFDAVQMTTQAIMSHLPAAIAQVQSSQMAAEKAEESFFQAWPDLDAAKHGDTIRKLGATYRQAFPNATAQDVITHVGAQAMVALKIVPAGTPGSEAQPPTATPPPPAAAAGGSGTVGKVKPKNAFAALAEEQDEEDASF